MSGVEFLSNNNIQGHFAYGIRKETGKLNLAAYGGLSYYNGVIGVADTSGLPVAQYHAGGGLYFCGQAVTKLSYDIGIGLEIFCELSKYKNVSGGLPWYQGAHVFSAGSEYQQLAGFKVILFFSGAYRGPKRNYNPHVRSENPK